MLNAYAIYRLLLDDELPPPEPPAEPAGFEEDPEAALNRYVDSPFKARGVPVTLYQEWKALLRNRRIRILRDMGRSTSLEELGDGSIGLRYHDTHVVLVTPENRVTVETGGWFTRTTLRRINEARPGGWGLFGRKPRKDAYDKWNYFWYNYVTRTGSYEDKRMFPYTDGDVIEPDGTLIIQARPDYSKAV